MKSHPLWFVRYARCNGGGCLAEMSLRAGLLGMNRGGDQIFPHHLAVTCEG